MRASESLPIRRARDLAAAQPGTRPSRDAALSRLRRGVYAEQEGWEALDETARYLVRMRAVDAARSRPIFARESALAIHDIPFGLVPADVYTTGDARTAGRKAGIVHAPAALGPGDVQVVSGLIVCSPAYALADVARRRDPLTAVSALDHALHHRTVTKPMVLEALGRQSTRGRAAAEWAVAFADGASESVGESWSRVRIFQLGFAAPELQQWVRGSSGEEHRVDMRWRLADRRPVYGEFDGLQKYGALANEAGRSGVQALAREKARDDDLLFTGDPAHWVWADVLRPVGLDRILTAYRIPRLRPPLPALRRAA
ncbi:hypothetical protein [Agrococcus sp. ProA11]|uniref:hypothetical protein n=1 Tax=Agrococcus chionoecetis TaxID=3153752 RepID=UPI003261334D